MNEVVRPLRRSDTGRERETVTQVIAVGPDLTVALAYFDARQDGTPYTEYRLTAFDSDGNPLGLLATKVGNSLTDAAITAAIAAAIRLFPSHAA